MTNNESIWATVSYKAMAEDIAARQPKAAMAHVVYRGDGAWNVVYTPCSYTGVHPFHPFDGQA
jgi:hypothetical protein